MGAYDTLDKAVKGLKSGIHTRDESWCCKESGGIEFGVPVFGYTGDQVGLYNFYNDTAILVFDADFVTANVIDGTVNTVAWTQVPFDTDHDTTAANLVTEIDSMTGVRAVLDATDATNRTILIQTKGAAAVAASTVTLGATQAGATATYSSSQTFVGVSLFDQKTPGGYALQDSVNVVAEGQIWVVPTLAVNALETAYIDNAATDIGTFSSAGLEVNAKYRSNAIAGALAEVYVYGQTKFTYAEEFIG